MTEMPVIRVLLADDHEAVRSGVAAILSTDPGIAVVAEAENGFDALVACHRTLPHVALIDLRMPGTDGIWATERIAAETDTRVLVLTTYDSDDMLSRALTAGANGYLLKSASGAEIIRAVRHVAAGRHVLDPAMAGALIAQATAAQRNEDPTAAPVTPEWWERTTARERDVCRFLIAGMTNQEIAAELHIGVTTVKTHVGSLYAKSGTSSRVELAQIASGIPKQ